MKRTIFFCMLFTIFFSSCATQQFILQDFNPNFIPQTKFELSKPYEEVWDKVIDYFAENNIAIKILEKASGLIVSTETEFEATYWLPDTKRLYNPHAAIAVQFKKGLKKDGTGLRTVAEWNIRVKKIGENKTVISINIANPTVELLLTHYNRRIYNKWELQYDQSAISTGVFEQSIIGYINSN